MKANSVSRTIRAPALGGSIRTRVIPTKWAMAAGSPSSEVLVTSAPPASKAHTTEVVVIGSGIGGLSAAAMLSKYGVKTTVLESHYIPGKSISSLKYVSCTSLVTQSSYGRTRN